MITKETLRLRVLSRSLVTTDQTHTKLNKLTLSVAPVPRQGLVRILLTLSYHDNIED